MIQFIIDAVRKFGSVETNIVYTAEFIRDEWTIEILIGVPGNSVRKTNMADIERIPELLNKICYQKGEVIDDMPMAESGCTFF